MRFTKSDCPRLASGGVLLVSSKRGKSRTKCTVRAPPSPKIAPAYCQHCVNLYVHVTGHFDSMRSACLEPPCTGPLTLQSASQAAQHHNTGQVKAEKELPSRPLQRSDTRPPEDSKRAFKQRLSPALRMLTLKCSGTVCLPQSQKQSCDHAEAVMFMLYGARAVSARPKHHHGADECNGLSTMALCEVFSCFSHAMPCRSLFMQTSAPEAPTEGAGLRAKLAAAPAPPETA